jgi:hypothetical protein
MKKVVLLMVLTALSVVTFAQTQSEEVTSKNSWLKLGVNAGVPFGNLSETSNFTLGAELKGQVMSTNHVGLGLTTGYNHFFPKDGFKNFGTVPLGLFVRYYPQSRGFFAGTDAGYSFITGVDGATGGVYVRPQLGYHNYNWNFFAFYNGIFRSEENGSSLQYAGIGATYNIRFHKKG